MWRYLALRKFGAVFAETLLLVWCVLGAYYLRLHESPFASAERHQFIPKALLIAAIFQLFLHLNDVHAPYDPPPVRFGSYAPYDGAIASAVLDSDPHAVSAARFAAERLLDG